MNTTSKNITVAHSNIKNDWSFLPTAFSAFAGVGLGIMIGNYLGLI